LPLYLTRDDVTGQSATFGVGRAHLGEHRLRVSRDELVQHRALGFTASVAGERLFAVALAVGGPLDGAGPGDVTPTPSSSVRGPQEQEAGAACRPGR
jgi:hypothetical protein